MYPGPHAEARDDQPAVIMADSGETVTYRELEARSNRLARLLRAVGLSRLDHYAIFMENHPRYIECCAAGERSGLYYTAINSFLTAGELAYIVNNSLSRVLITSEAKRDVALAALADCPAIELCLIVDGPGEGERVRNLDDATAESSRYPDRRRNARRGDALFLGHDRPPKGVLRPLPDQPPAQMLNLLVPRFRECCGFAKARFTSRLRLSTTRRPWSVSLRRFASAGRSSSWSDFDPERFLELVEKYSITHTQLVPTMFSRMLKLPGRHAPGS